MKKILIVDASASDGRIMTGLLARADYNPVVAESVEAGKVEAAKLPPRGYRHGNAIARWYRKRVNQLVKDGKLRFPGLSHSRKSEQY